MSRWLLRLSLVVLIDGVFDDWRLRDLLLLWNNDFLAVFLTLLLVPFLSPWALVIGDVSLGFVHLVKFGNVSLHVAEVPDHNSDEDEWTAELVGRSVRLLVMVTVVASSAPLMSAVFLMLTSVVLSSHHTHESWLLIIFIVILLFAKVAAMENGSWETLGLIEGSAGWFDGSTDAPRAVAGVSVALIFGCILAFVGLVWVLTSHEFGPLVDDAVSQFFVVVVVSLWGSWSLILGVTVEDSGWELLGVVDGEAGGWNG